MSTRTRVVNVKHSACDVYVGRAFGRFTLPSPVNPVPGRFGNPFKPGGVTAAGQRRALLAAYFGAWLGRLAPTAAKLYRSMANARMADPDGDALDAFRWYLDLRARHDPDFRRDVLGLRGKRLGCWCVDKDGNGPCHARVLNEWVDSQKGLS